MPIYQYPLQYPQKDPQQKQQHSPDFKQEEQQPKTWLVVQKI